MMGAMIAKTHRSCGWCGQDISGKRETARYCSITHKKASAAKRHRERNPTYYRDLYRTPGRRAYMRKRYEEKREQILAYSKEYRRLNLEYYQEAGRAWWAANEDRHRNYQAKRRARIKGNPDGREVSLEDVRRTLATGRCFYCWKVTPKLHLDHVIPLVRGGRHAISNLVPSCITCNSSKRASFIIEMKRKGVVFPWSTPTRREACPLS